MFSKVRVTDVVPAPDEPVMAMMGWRSDMGLLLVVVVNVALSLGTSPFSRETTRALRRADCHDLLWPVHGDIVRCARPRSSIRTPGRCAGAARTAARTTSAGDPCWRARPPAPSGSRSGWLHRAGVVAPVWPCLWYRADTGRRPRASGCDAPRRPCWRSNAY